MNYREMKNELMMGWDSYDRWACAMGMWFDVCEELFRRGDDIPAEWEFRAGALGVGEPESYEAEIMGEAESSDLLRLGNVLQRYVAYLKKIGESY